MQLVMPLLVPGVADAGGDVVHGATALTVGHAGGDAVAAAG